MTNDLKNFLEGETIRFSDDYCEFKLADTITKPELLNYKRWLEDHDTRLINFVLDLVEKEVEKKEDIKKLHQQKLGEWCPMCGVWKQYGVLDNHFCRGYIIT